MSLVSRGLGRIVGITLAGIAGIALVLFLIAWAGVYNVAASRGHWVIIEWFLAFGMRNSVQTRALAIKAPPLGNPSLVQLGAAHFHGGCAFCHAAPGVLQNPTVGHMLPSPPTLSTAANEWRDNELFWIVKNGIKYTGMPSWVALERDDEVWAVVAFLKQLPGLDAEAYRKLAVGGLQDSRPSGADIATTGSNTQAVDACARCHGADDNGPMSRLVPILHAQPAEFLITALQAYAAGTRQSGIMQPVATGLTTAALRTVAEYYAGLSPLRRQATRGADAVEKGRKLALEGIAANGVPPCMSCHGKDALPRYPRLAGQHAEYMAAQLRLWKRGVAPGTDGAAIMAPIAQRLSEQEIDQAAAYFASLVSQSADEVRRP